MFEIVKEESFDDVIVQHANLFELVSRVSEMLERQKNWVSRREGISFRELHLLLMIGKHGDIRQGLLAERCFISRQAGFVAVKRLIARGLVVSFTRNDGREVRLRLTATGAARLKQARNSTVNLQLSIERSFGVKERNALVSLLEQFRVAVRDWDTQNLVILD